MSTKIGVIAEGPIDHALLDALLRRIAQDKAQFRWPIDPHDVAETFPLRKRGHGGVLETVRKLVRVLESGEYDHAGFVIVLDERTRDVQNKLRRLIRGKRCFVLGIAVKEIEAWWLGDRTNTLKWLGLDEDAISQTRYADPQKYSAEKDDNPKRTLDELTRLSDRLDRCYGSGNLELAVAFAEDYWFGHARLDDIARQCPNGFGRFQRDMINKFCRVKAREGRLF